MFKIKAYGKFQLEVSKNHHVTFFAQACTTSSSTGFLRSLIEIMGHSLCEFWNVI